MSKKIYKRDIERHDAVRRTSLLRELEMAVDRIVSEQGMRIQFFVDLERYGLKEAQRYLWGFLEEKKRVVSADDQRPLSEVVQKINSLF